MTTTQVQALLSVAAAGLGLTGSMVLAFSLDRPLEMLRAHVLAVDTTVSALVGRDNVPVFTGFEEQHKREFAASAQRVRLGAWLLVLAFLAQGGSSLVSFLSR